MNEKIKRVGVWLLVFLSVAILIWGFFKLIVSSSSVSVKPSSINDSDWVKGNKQAKVVIMEYSDFQCPACKFYHPLVKQLTDEYKDKIAFVYRHFPLGQHKNANTSAYAAEAAGLQGKFWEMSDLIFDNQEDWSEKNNAEEIFKSYASKLGLDPIKFADNLKSASIKEKVDKDKQSGESIGVDATPTFYLNGVKLKNIGSYNDFKKTVEEKLQSQ